MSQQIADYSADEIVTGLYRAILGREPDPDGLQNYTEVLKKGHGVEFVAAALMHSLEYRDRLMILRQMIE